MVYLCYDLKGIQSFIFAVPRLKYICGGSAIIDRFDRDTVPSLDVAGATLLFAGGGKGAFRCESERVAENLEQRLAVCARRDGLGVSMGVDESYSEAAHRADRTYPYLPPPEELDGHPCTESGLYPTRDQVHRMIRRREGLRSRYEEDLSGEVLPNPGNSTIEFFRDVDQNTPEGRQGWQALGGRNRYAIIAMDGNDMGSQHRVAEEKWGHDTQKYAQWLARMSEALDGCTRDACREAIRRVVDEWFVESGAAAQVDGPGALVVPLRPLLVGGDDIVILCHVRHALRFVTAACDAFARLSREKAAEARRDGFELWPATGGALTITAGVLFAPVSMPLAAAIPYAESLLASAKGEGRKHVRLGEPSPPCVDWESVTEGLLDSPVARRVRDLTFTDADNKDELVELTRRPYTLEGLVGLEELRDRYARIPSTIRHGVLSGLRQGYWDRKVYVARLHKHQQALARDLAEEGGPNGRGKGRWKVEERAGKRVRHTDVVDALLLLEEDGRMRWAEKYQG